MTNKSIGAIIFATGSIGMSIIDGAFIPMLFAIGVGYFVSKRLTRIAQRPAQVAIQSEITRICTEADAEQNPELKKKKIKEADSAKKKLQVELNKLQKTAGHVSDWVGVGAFGAPIISLGIMAASEINMRNRVENVNIP